MVGGGTAVNDGIVRTEGDSVLDESIKVVRVDVVGIPPDASEHRGWLFSSR